MLLKEQLHKLCGVFFGDGVGGATRSRCFNGGYNDLALLHADYH